MNTLDDLVNTLRGIGFTKNEAQVYLATLELGPSSIWDISKKSGIKRPTCYVILDELIWKGYASSTNDGRRAIYNVESPKQVLRAVERRYTKFSENITQIEAIASKSPLKPNVRLYEGTQGVIEAYNLTLERPKGSELLIYGTSKVETSYGDFIKDYITIRKENGIRARVLLANIPPNRSVTLRDTSELRETRFLDLDKFNPQTETIIFGDSIAYIAHSEKSPFATVIENATLAKEEAERFDILWDTARI